MRTWLGRGTQASLPLFSDCGNRPGHAEALTRLGELSPLPDAGDKSDTTEPLPSQLPGKGRAVTAGGVRAGRC